MKISARTRIAIGLSCMLVTVLCTAMMMGMVPEPNSAIMEGRANVCETIAMVSSDYISRGQLRRLESFLRGVVDRNDSIQTAGVRKTSGQLVASIGKHADNWDIGSENRSTETHVHVPIRNGREKWGSVELCFEPISKTGWASYYESPWLRLILFTTAGSYLLFLYYLKKMLSHLDPSQSVPQRVRSALDSLAEGLLVIDRKGRIVLANQSFAAWVGRDAERLIGVDASSLNWVKNDQGDALREYPWINAIRLEAPQAGVMLGIKRKDDPIRVLIANASPVLGHDGKYRGVLVSFDDVTQLEETKKNLRRAKQIADNANQAKSEFLARMSHEIRTPMNAILGYTDVMRRGFDESVENRQQYLNTIHASGEHLLALINDILDLSKVESGQMELELERYSPHKIIHQVAALLKSKADEKGISLNVEFEGKLPETILADEVRLRQAIMNLAGNAIKFTDTGGVTIAARLLPEKSDSPTFMAIDVSDTGIGIPKEAQAKIFEPFAQADTSVTRKFGGTGLGLAISKQLSEAMGGGISLTSVEGKGSTFTVTIDVGPLDRIKLVDGETALAAAAQSSSTEKKEVIQLPPARILVADDGESNRKLIELVLGRAGVDVTSVENGKLAMDAALENPFDVVLMDMQMPVMDGYTASTKLREAGYEAPIIALTAHAMRGDEEKCREAGCSGFLTKPVNIDVLLSTLAELLSVDGESEDIQQSKPVAPTSRTNAADAIEAASRHPEVGDVLDVFIKDMQDQINGMHDAVARRSASELGRIAHSLYGASGTFGFSEIATLAGKIEQCVETRQLHDIEKTVAELMKLAREVVHARRASFAPTENATADANNESPLACALPLDDPDFLEIAHEFVQRLNEQLTAMRTALAGGDDDQLAALAHWLKGSGGTAGFDAFTEPAYELEMAAKSRERDKYESLVDHLHKLADRIKLKCEDVSEPTTTQDSSDRSEAESPLISSLPMDDIDFREIVEEFVVRLDKKLQAMESASTSGDYAELAALAHWLKGSGGTAGFDAFTPTAKELEQLAKQGDQQPCTAAIAKLRRIAGRIVIPEAV